MEDGEGMEKVENEVEEGGHVSYIWSLATRAHPTPLHNTTTTSIIVSSLHLSRTRCRAGRRASRLVYEETYHGRGVSSERK